MYFHERVARELKTLHICEVKANDFSKVFAW